MLKQPETAGSSFSPFVPDSLFCLSFALYPSFALSSFCSSFPLFFRSFCLRLISGCCSITIATTCLFSFSSNEVALGERCWYRRISCWNQSIRKSDIEKRNNRSIFVPISSFVFLLNLFFVMKRLKWIFACLILFSANTNCFT